MMDPIDYLLVLAIYLQISWILSPLSYCHFNIGISQVNFGHLKFFYQKLQFYFKKKFIHLTLSVLREKIFNLINYLYLYWMFWNLYHQNYFIFKQEHVNLHWSRTFHLNMMPFFIPFLIIIYMLRMILLLSYYSF
jgi:hypothetical protein